MDARYKEILNASSILCEYCEADFAECERCMVNILEESAFIEYENKENE